MSISDKSTSTCSSGRRSLTVEFVRDPGVCGEWLNRFCKDVETQEVLYYCDVYDDSGFEIHRGNKYGPVIGRTGVCKKHPGSTDLLIGGPRHIHHDGRTLKTHFTANGNKYHWNGRMELIEDGTGTILAQMVWPAKHTQKLKTGKLVIHDCPEELTDPIVMSAMMVQERSDEANTWF